MVSTLADAINALAVWTKVVMVSTLADAIITSVDP